ncbi:MAG TPA: flavodoxin domain-containing protein [Geobacteraceae bacterium]|nr:flavodoxin domain-containing protein [Geobacteraceae bacterium]
MAKALVLYTTRTGETRSMAQKIAEGMRSCGVEVTLLNISDFDAKMTDPQSYDAIVLGSPTYHGEMTQPMKDLLFALAEFNLEGKVGGAFGAFGWSGEVPGRIYGTMKHVFKMDMASGPLQLKSASSGMGARSAQNYGIEIASKIKSE